MRFFYIHGIKINSSISFFYIIALSQGGEYDSSNSTITPELTLEHINEIPVLTLNHPVGSLELHYKGLSY